MNYRDFNIYDMMAIVACHEMMEVPAAIKYSSQEFLEALKHAVPQAGVPADSSVVMFYGLRIVQDPEVPPDRIRLEYVRGGQRNYKEFVISQRSDTPEPELPTLSA